MSDRPTDKDMNQPWTTSDCECESRCDKCDGYGWYYINTKTNVTLSEMMRSAMDRHG